MAGPDPHELRRSRALAAGRAGTWEWDRRSGVVEWDTALEALYGLSAGSFGGRFEDWIELIHPDDRDQALADLEQTLTSSPSHFSQFRAVRPSGAVRWIESRGRVRREGGGEVLGIAGVCHDVTDRLEAEQRAKARSEFLEQAGHLLASASTDVDETLQELTRLVVPQLADWCAIDLSDEVGDLRLAAVAHQDPDRVALLQHLVERYGRDPEEGAGRVARTGEVVHLPGVTEELLRASAEDEGHLAGLLEIGLVSVVIVPLRARGRLLGSLSLAHSDSGRQHDEDDVTLAQELADRAAIAIDNANIVNEHRRVAAMLQQALLPPELPNVSGVEAAAQYDPAHAGVVGGDFYDLIGAGEDWTLVIGDVCGKGVGAAATASMARHTVRAAALRDPDPTHVLEVLNEALLVDDRDEGYCTAACAHLRIGNGAVEVTAAAGGHPPPLILRADGAVEPVGAVGMALGWFDDAALTPGRDVLEPGDLLFLYSDGLSEARQQDELFGTERVAAALTDATGLAPEAVVKQIHDTVERWQDGQHDDIAMLAVRVVDGTAAGLV